MKQLFLAFLIVLGFALLAIQIFRDGFARGFDTAKQDIVVPADNPATATSSGTARVYPVTTSSDSFKGPSSPPKIIGPRNDPPNY